MASIGSRQLGLPRPPIPWKPGFPEDMNAPVKLSDRPQGALLMPKRKPLPSVFALGKCPPKPQRPPHVNCDVFRRNAKKSSPETNSTELFPPPPDLLSITSETPPPPDHFIFPPPPPSLDPGLLEDYDDVEFMNATPSSLGKSCSDLQESNEETYEDRDSSRPEHDNESSEKEKSKDSKAVKKRFDRDEKKRSEQEKKEKKLQEKREQEARKKFKIKGPVMVVSTVKANVDHKSGKNKLPLRRGETIHIIRTTENPKSYWLARNREGHYGFVKPDTVDECTEIVTRNVLYNHNNRGTDDQLKNLPAGNVNERDWFVTADESDADVYEYVEEDFSFPPPPPDLEFNPEVGYVSTANVEQDNSVYDDVGEECIYDND